MTSETDTNGKVGADHLEAHSAADETIDEKNLEPVATSVTHEDNLVYNDDEEEPELHARTYIALAALFALNLVLVFALQGPGAILSFIGADLKNPAEVTWIPNALVLVQAVMSPLLSSISDIFQARKTILVSFSVLSFIGAAIAPGSATIYRLIGAQILCGFGFSTVALAYSVPSEIVPKKWRPMIQSLLNIAGSTGAATGPLIAGALTKRNPHTGWRIFYWIQMGLWGVTALGLFVGYRPPKRHTRMDHLSLWQKIGKLDLPGCGLLVAGLTLFLVGLNIGGGKYKWTAAPVLATIIVGGLVLVAFGIYEWKFTETGILHHDLFRGGAARGRTFAICLGLMLIEGLMAFSIFLFYPVLTTNLFEPDPFLEVARGQPFWITTALSTLVYGYISTKLRTIRAPLFVGFFIFTAGLVAFATIQPKDSTSAIVFDGLTAMGFAAPLILIIAGVQLSTPHHLIATATAVTASARAVSATMFTAIYAAAISNRNAKNIPNYIAAAAAKAGLPAASIPAFVGALAGGNATALAGIPDVNPAIIGAGTAALKQALADGIRIVYIIAAPFGVVACILCLFLGDMKKAMSYRVDAPVEVLHAKHHHEVTA